MRQNSFFDKLINATSVLIQDNVQIVKLLYWVNQKARLSKHPGVGTRANFLFIAFDLQHNYRYNTPGPSGTFSRVSEEIRDLAGSLARHFDLDSDDDLSRDKDDWENNIAIDYILARNFGVDIDYYDDPIFKEWDVLEQAGHIEQYLRANQLLIECLREAAISNQAEIEERLLRSP